MASTKEAMIAECSKWADQKYKEGPNNDTIFGRWYGLNYQPWCAMFISYCAYVTNNADIIPRHASCLVGVAWFKKRGQFDRNPKAGDIVYFGPGGGTHVELVISVNGNDLHCVGGNTTNTYSANGDGCYYKTYRNWKNNQRIYGFGHPAYTDVPAPNPTPPTPTPVPPKTNEDAMAFTTEQLKDGPNLILVPPTNGGAVGWGGVYISLAAVGGDVKVRLEVWMADLKKKGGSGWATVGEYDIAADGPKVALGIPAGVDKILATRSGNTGALVSWAIEAKQA